jgi:hypothetical protein
MTPPETAAIKREAKPDNTAAAETRVAEEARAARARVDQARIARWVAAQIVAWRPDNCFHCRRPIVYGAKWVELVNDNNRARFHFDCAPVWRAQREAAARRAMGLDRSERN